MEGIYTNVSFGQIQLKDKHVFLLLIAFMVQEENKVFHTTLLPKHWAPFFYVYSFTCMVASVWAGTGPP